jgi:two-component system LytT family sensor kinase
MGNLNRIQRKRLIHFTAWISFAVFSLLVTASIAPLDLALYRLSVAIGSLIIAYYFNSEVLVQRLYERGKYVGYFLLAVLLVSILTVIRGYLLSDIFVDGRPYIPETTLVLVPGLSFFLAGTAIASIVVLSAFIKITENRSEKERQLERLAREKADAQLDYLKAQINPHFLFNTLNNIYSLAYRKSDRAPEMILKLSSLLRYVLYDCREDKVTVEQELMHNRLFIDIFQIKREAPYPITFTAEVEQPDLLIEPMLFIPLLENSLKHADLDHNPEAFLEIELRNTGQEVQFSIRNTFDTGDKAKDEVGGIGLANVQRRLELNYPGNHSFDIRSANGIFTVHLQFKVP